MRKSQKAEKKAEQNNTGKPGRLNFSILAAVFFVAITAIFPLYVTRTGYVSITKEKTDLFLIFTFIAAIGAVIAIFVTAERFSPVNTAISYLRKTPFAIYDWALLVFLLLTLLSAIFSPWKDFVWNGFTINAVQGRWEGFWAFLAYCIAFFIIARLYHPERRHFLIFAYSASFLSICGILQYMGFDIFYATKYIIVEVNMPPLTRTFRTTLGNINIVSAYCSLIIVLFAALFSTENSRWGIFYLIASSSAFWLQLITGGDAGNVGVLGAMLLLIPYWFSGQRRLGRILIVLSSWCVVHSANQLYLSFIKSKTAVNSNIDMADKNFLDTFTPFYPVPFIFLAVILLAGGLFLLYWKKKWSDRYMKIVGISLLGIIFIGGIIFVEILGSRITNQPNNTIWQAREVLHGRFGNNFGSGRGWIWKAGMSVIKENPILGTGPDTFFFALGGEQTTPLVDAMIEPQVILSLGGLQFDGLRIIGQFVDKAHNTFLQIAVCMGLPALLAYLVFLGALFLPSIKKAFNRPVLFAFGAGALSYLIQCFFQVDTPIDRPLLYIALGVMAVELKQGTDRSADVPDIKKAV